MQRKDINFLKLGKWCPSLRHCVKVRLKYSIGLKLLSCFTVRCTFELTRSKGNVADFSHFTIDIKKEFHIPSNTLNTTFAYLYFRKFSQRETIARYKGLTGVT